MMGYRRGTNPNSRKNLRPFKRGLSGNLEGARRHDKILQPIRRLASEQVRLFATLILRSSVADLEMMMKDKTQPAIVVWMVSIALKGIRTGNCRSLELFLNRLLGPPRAEKVHNHQCMTFADFAALASEAQ